MAEVILFIVLRNDDQTLKVKTFIFVQLRLPYTLFNIRHTCIPD